MRPPGRRPHTNGPVLLAAVVLLLAACGDGGSSSRSAASTSPSSSPRSGSATAAEPALRGEITVAAAASLTEPFTTLGADFEADHPGTRVTFTFDSSSALAGQVLEGAPVDVFASADEASTTELVDAGRVVGAPAAFARNRLTIVTRPGNPTQIAELADLARGHGVVSLCGADVPCGKLAARALDRAGVALPEGRVTRGQNAKATLAAVAEGDAVAAIVYVTDARAAGDAVDAVAIPDASNVLAVYPISVLTGSQAADVAEAFVSFVRSARGRRVLTAAGFLAPA